jgi:hypothetical protein
MKTLHSHTVSRFHAASCGKGLTLLSLIPSDRNSKAWFGFLLPPNIRMELVVQRGYLRIILIYIARQWGYLKIYTLVHNIKRRNGAVFSEYVRLQASTFRVIRFVNQSRYSVHGLAG